MDGFYEEDQPVRVLRLGDVITGFQLATAQIHEPLEERANWTIGINKPSYLAVMTPCCSFEKKCIVLTPLLHIRPSFLKNQHFEQDLTRINRKVAPEQGVPAGAWEQKLSPERKEKMLAIGPAYTFRDCFIYGQHDLLSQYKLDCKSPIMIGYYMVDFKCMYRIDSKMIDRDKDPPLNVKILQLSVQTREELRRKLADYFGRTPDEDSPL